MFLQASPNWGQLFEWCYQHVGVIGYPSIALFVWKASGWFNETKAQVFKTIGQIDHLSTNHFPHMQASLEKQDKLLESVDISLKTMVERMPMQAKRASKRV